MARIKNNGSGIVHAEGTYIFLAACGASPYSFKSLPDSAAVTCKSCKRILEEREEPQEGISVMSGIKNKKSGVVHAEGCTTFLTLCGTWSDHKFIKVSGGTAITCKTCLRMIKNREKEEVITCKLENCIRYDEEATTYCCNACSADAYDYERLSKEDLEMEEKRKDLAEYVKNYKKKHELDCLCFLKLSKETRKALAGFIETHADIHEDTILSGVIDQIINSHTAYLKEDLF